MRPALSCCSVGLITAWAAGYTLTSSGNVAVAASSPATAPQAIDAPGESSFRLLCRMYTFFKPAEARITVEDRRDILQSMNTERSRISSSNAAQ